MHVKKKYESGSAAAQYAKSVADTLATIVQGHTGKTPTVSMAAPRTIARPGMEVETVRIRFSDVGGFDPMAIDPATLPDDVVGLGPNRNGAFTATIDVSGAPASSSKSEGTDIVNARKIQAGLVEMEAMLAAVGKNVSFEYVPDDDIVKISVDNRVVKIASVWGDSAITAMNDVWTAVYRYLT